MECKCIKFANDLFMMLLCTDLSKRQLLLKKLEDFVKQYPCYTYEVNKLCKIMLDRIKNSDKDNLKEFLIEICNLICLSIMTEKRKFSGCLLIYYKCFGSISLPRLLHTLYYSIDNISYYMSKDRVLIALGGESKYMKLLVNLDIFSYLSTSMIAHTIAIEIISILYDLMGHCDGTEDFLPDREHFDKCNKVINMARYLIFPGDDFRSLKRIHLTLITIKATSFNRKQEKNIAKEIIYCLKMYFTVTLDPLLTINEVKSMLYVFLFVYEKLNLFESFYEELLKIMPDCPVKFEPRNLTDLARCEIRKNIRKCNLHFPAAVAQLNLSQPLKEFVLGNVIHMSRRSENVTPEESITKSQLEDLVSESDRFITSEISF